MTNASQIKVRGELIDETTRCVHYHSPLDVIAIKFRCCQAYYPCYACHEGETDHPVQRWPELEFDTLAVLCGCCQKEMTIREYLSSNNQCPSCGASFNPKCRNHHHLYFQVG
ncbi:MAG: CHY zinc finger protein [Flavisolibacter sp.]